MSEGPLKIFRSKRFNKLLIHRDQFNVSEVEVLKNKLVAVVHLLEKTSKSGKSEIGTIRFDLCCNLKLWRGVFEETLQRARRIKDLMPQTPSMVFAVRYDVKPENVQLEKQPLRVKLVEINFCNAVNKVSVDFKI